MSVLMKNLAGSLSEIILDKSQNQSQIWKTVQSEV